MDVVDGGKGNSQHFVGAEHTMDVRTRIMLTSVTATICLNRTVIVFEAGVAEIQAELGQRRTIIIGANVYRRIPRHTGRSHTIKRITPTLHCRENIRNCANSQQVARFVAVGANGERHAIQQMLVFRQARFLRGGDHSALNEAGFPAVRFTVPAEDYSRQHQNVSEKDGKPYGDVASFVDGEYLTNVTRLNLATLIHMANAPTPPGNARIITAELATDTLLRWDASPEPDTAGYEVVYRLTTDADWTGMLDAGTKRELRVGLSKDNVFFGVRAYDRDGFRSPVSFAWAAKE